MKTNFVHIPVLLQEVLESVPARGKSFLDVTAGGGGHTCAILAARPEWQGECWDRDPEAPARIEAKAQAQGVAGRLKFRKRCFGEGAEANAAYDYILADLGVSSFQLDDAARGMSLHAESPPDFRMDPSQGPTFAEWLGTQSDRDLTHIIEMYGEEPRAAAAARALKGLGAKALGSAKELGEVIAVALGYPRRESRVHPATRVFQALRIAINDELGELEKFLAWAPQALAPGGHLAIITFHSLEDRAVKWAYRDLADKGPFDILTKRPLVPSDGEIAANARSRSAKFRVLARRGEGA